MSVDFHRHCQATVLSANGTDEQNGLSWTYISRLKDSLDNLPENWIEEFKGNIENITQDLASILKIMNSTVDNYLPLSGGTMTGDLILNGSPETDNQAATKRYVDYVVGQNSGGTITGITMNGVLKGTEGEVDLGNVVSSIKVNGDVKTPNSNGLVDIGTFSVTNTDNNGTTISRITYNGKSYDIKMTSRGGESGGGSGDGGEGNVIFMNNPVGTIISWTGNTSNLPEGYLVCDGSEVSQADYAELYTVIGDKFGTSSEEGKFKLPNLVDGTYLQGNMNSGSIIDAGLPSISGKLTGTTDNSGEHTHTYTKITTRYPPVKNDGAEDFMINRVDSSAETGSAGNHSHTINCDFSIEGGVYGKSDTVTPKSMTVIYLICSKVITPSGGQSSFNPSKFHTIFFNPGNATSIEFTTKSLYEGSQYGRLPKYTLGGVEMNTWYQDAELTQQVLSTTIFNKTNDIELFNSITPDIPDNPDNPGTGDTGGTVNASPLCFTAKEANSTVELIKNSQNSQAISLNLEYKLEGSTTHDWSSYTGQLITLEDVDDKMYMRATSEGNETISSVFFIYQFEMTGRIAASGNIQTLIDQTGNRMDVPQYCYHLMFKDCTSLTTPPELPATTLDIECYYRMFEGCTSLTSVPELPATTLVNRCYAEMFKDCTSLTTPPELPATTLDGGCYAGMFRGCAALTTAPELPSTTLASGCYEAMFFSCPLFSTVKMKASMNGVYNKSSHGDIGKTVEYVL